MGFTLSARDTVTGTSKAYSNEDRHAAAPVQDLAAFGCGAAAASEEVAAAPGPALPQLRPGFEPFASEDWHLRGDPPDAAAFASLTCVPDATTLCLDNRFGIKVNFQTVQGNLSGSGMAIPLASLGVTRGGLFWFFDATNPELLLKVIDGCALNQELWIFYSATTNVGFTVTVTDTLTGHSKSYTNPDLLPAPPVQDVNALACN